MSGPQRIVCLTEETTEWLYLLKEDWRIVGISAYTVRPAQAKEDKPIVSAFLSGNVQKIVELQPDLVIGFSDIQADLAQKLIKAGLNVLITNQRSLEEIFSNLMWIAQLVGQSERAQKWLADAKMEIIRTQTEARAYYETAGRPRPRVFFQEWNEPIITGIRWVSELVEVCGGLDVFKEKSLGSLAKDRIVSAEDVQRAAPDIIIGSWCGKPVDYGWIRAQSGWSFIPALQNNNLYELDPSIILQPGPALFLDGIQELKRILLPKAQ